MRRSYGFILAPEFMSQESVQSVPKAFHQREYGNS